MTKITTELVAVEQPLWKGKATLVSARATEGEVGVLPGYQPSLGQLVSNGTVAINTADGKVLVASTQGGFISVSTSEVSILADKAIWADEINLSKTESSLTSGDPAVKAQAESEVRAARRASTNRSIRLNIRSHGRILPASLNGTGSW